MRRRGRVAGAIIALAAVAWPGAGLLAAGPALSHSPDPAYPYRWKAPDNGGVRWFFASDHFLHDAGAAARVLEASLAWNAAAAAGGGVLAYVPAGYDPTLAWDGCNLWNVNGVFWLPIDGPGGTLAQARACVWASDGTRMFSFRIGFDSAEDWHTGAGPPPSTRFDLGSSAAHELGHATGFWTHWEDIGATSLCPNDDTQHTMCKFGYRGTARKRSLEPHDRHTAASAYRPL